MDSGLNEALRSAGGSALKAASTGAVLVLLGVCLLGRAGASEQSDDPPRLVLIEVTS